MTEEKLQEIMKRFRRASEDIRGDEMIDIYEAENIIREVCGLYQKE